MVEPFSGLWTARAWRHVVSQAAAEFRADHVSIIASGVAFRATLAIFPGVAVLVWIGSRVISPDDLRSALLSIAATMPESMREIVGQATSSQLARAPGADSALGVLGPLFALALAVWSANSGVKAMFISLNTIFDRTEARTFLHLTLLTFAFTFSAVILLLLVIALIVAGPSILSLSGISPDWLAILVYLRWPVLLAVSTFAVGLLYRYAPNRDGERWSIVTWGAIAAALALTGCSAAFSWFIGRFASLAVTYGSLSSIFAFMIWMWLSFTLVLAGAEVDAAIAGETAGGEGDNGERPRKQKSQRQGTTV